MPKKLSSLRVIKMYKKFSGIYIAKKMGVSKLTIYRILKKANVSIRSNSEAQKLRFKFRKKKGVIKNKIKRPSTNREKMAEAYVIGALMGDGYLTKYSLRLKVTQKGFIHEFARCIKESYGITPHMNKYGNAFICDVHSVLLSKRLNRITDGKRRIPVFILRGNDEVKGSFLKGFVDAEGSVDNKHERRQIVITQKDIKLLINIQKLLLNIGIQSKLYKKKNNPAQLVISLFRNLKRFHRFVGFSITYKKERLERAIEYLENLNIPTYLYWNALRKFINNNDSLERQAKELNIKWGTLRSWVRGVKIPNQVKKDIKSMLYPHDYCKLVKYYPFLLKLENNEDLQ